MIDYYILLPNDDINNLTNVNKLGSLGLNNTFWPDLGFDVLYEILDKYPELIEKVKIINSKKTKFTVSEFIIMLEKYKIKKL